MMRMSIIVPVYNVEQYLQRCVDSLLSQDIDNYEIAKELLNCKQYPNTYSPSYTIEEAKEILQALTPWKIDWGDSS